MRKWSKHFCRRLNTVNDLDREDDFGEIDLLFPNVIRVCVASLVIEITDWTISLLSTKRVAPDISGLGWPRYRTLQGEEVLCRLI
jgi:hypothetical protein